MAYDSRPDTLNHIALVQQHLAHFSQELERRGRVHDQSKLESPEKEIFDEHTPKLRELTYGSDEYRQCLEEMQVALKHHYAHNSHHPEHHEHGVAGMTLWDLVEMFCDWQAAVARHADGDLLQSIETNRERFELSDQLTSIFLNTANALQSPSPA